MGLVNTVHFLARHPLSRGRVLANLMRFVRWQIGARLVPGPVVVDFANGTVLLARPGMTGATGNVYVGLHEFEDMALVLHLLRPGDLFVDVGANIGSYTLLACGGAGANGIAFEPDPEAFGWLQRNVQLNGLTAQVEAHRRALGAEAGQVTFSIGQDTINHVIAGTDTTGGQTVQVTTLDTVLRAKCPVVMKIDVEGYETAVIDGATATLENPELRCVIMELMGGGARYGFDETALRGRLREWGFREYVYFPFERRLQHRAASEMASNTVFVRDHDFVAERVEAAPPIDIRGWQI